MPPRPPALAADASFVERPRGEWQAAAEAVEPAAAAVEPAAAAVEPSVPSEAPPSAKRTRMAMVSAVEDDWGGRALSLSAAKVGTRRRGTTELAVIDGLSECHIFQGFCFEPRALMVGTMPNVCEQAR